MRIHPSEVYLSKSYHKLGIPLLFCPTTLKIYGLNQVDLSRVYRGIVELTEVKSSGTGYKSWLIKMKRSQYRTKKIGRLVNSLFNNRRVTINCVVVGARK
ncbi:hypothetical protein N9N67_08540 [Bacteriovoracaceae bacterium]|nr:hypothetical protein [Bacteriovoracaceae bacterium]